MRLAGLALRCAEAVFSFLSFVIMGSNKQGQRGLKFDEYSVAIGVIAFVYLPAQLGRGIYDQVLAYLLISSSSSAASITNTLRDTKFKEMAAASVSMSFITFALMAASSLLSGFALTKRVGW